MVTPEEKDRLLKKYWSIPERQVETSVVLGEGGGSAIGNRSFATVTKPSPSTARSDMFSES